MISAFGIEHGHEVRKASRRTRRAAIATGATSGALVPLVIHGARGRRPVGTALKLGSIAAGGFGGGTAIRAGLDRGERRRNAGGMAAGA